MDQKKLAVSERCLIRRINRKLSANAMQLSSAAGLRVETSVGRYFIVDVKRNRITQQHVDLEELGRELGVLADEEEVVFGPSLGRYGTVPPEIWKVIAPQSPLQLSLWDF